MLRHGGAENQFAIFGVCVLQNLTAVLHDRTSNVARSDDAGVFRLLREGPFNLLRRNRHISGSALLLDIARNRLGDSNLPTILVHLCRGSNVLRINCTAIDIKCRDSDGFSHIYVCDMVFGFPFDFESFP